MKTRMVGPGSGDVTKGMEAFQGDEVIQAEFHDMSSVTINGNAGAWVALGSGGALPAAGRRIRLAYTSGQPFSIRKAANAGDAASASDLFVVNQGEDSFDVPVKLEAGDLLWVRSLSSTPIESGYITANIMG